jgi:hypothetical protein
MSTVLKFDGTVFLIVKMTKFKLQLLFVFAVLTPPEWVCRESEP